MRIHTRSLPFVRMGTSGSRLPSVAAVWTSVWLVNMSHGRAAARHPELVIKGPRWTSGIIDICKITGIHEYCNAHEYCSVQHTRDASFFTAQRCLSHCSHKGSSGSLWAFKIDENSSHPGLIENCKSDWLHLLHFPVSHTPAPRLPKSLMALF